MAAAEAGPQTLGLVPDNAIVAGQVHVNELLDLDRLQRLMNSWGAVLGDQADDLVSELTAAYNADVAPLATNIEYCVIYARSFQNDAPVTVCEGDFGATGYVPPDLSELEVIDQRVLVMGSQRAEAIAQLESSSGSATVNGVAIDSSLLAHLVVTLPPETADMAGALPLPIQSIEHLELRISEDPTQLGSLAVEIRIATDSPDAATTFHALLAMMAEEVPLSAAEMEAIGVSADDIRGWVQIEGNTVVVRPATDVLATMAGAVIPAASQQLDTVRSQAIQVRPASN